MDATEAWETFDRVVIAQQYRLATSGIFMLAPETRKAIRKASEYNISEEESDLIERQLVAENAEKALQAAGLILFDETSELRQQVGMNQEQTLRLLLARNHYIAFEGMNSYAAIQKAFKEYYIPNSPIN